MFSLFDLFNQLAQRGQRVTLNWLFDAEDDIAEEFGQELALDFTDLQVNLQAELAS
ncbi:SiaC family regulatory phosphoprotein [Pantoea dispersa]|uniref:SiaC family regulatory phosphoprotein n=1 Tax=Pantoea dispersa TaxID=59814 RepID=UPI003016BCDF